MGNQPRTIAPDEQDRKACGSEHWLPILVYRKVIVSDHEHVVGSKHNDAPIANRNRVFAIGKAREISADRLGTLQ